MADFTPLGLDHVVLRVKDQAATQRFYIDVLGCTLELRQGTLAQLRAGSALIDIVPADDEGPAKGTSSTGGANLDHLCLRIEPFDPGALTAQLIRHGVMPGEIKSRYGADGYGPSVYISDPESNTVELKGPPESRPAVDPQK